MKVRKSFAVALGIVLVLCACAPISPTFDESMTAPAALPAAVPAELATDVQAATDIAPMAAAPAAVPAGSDAASVSLTGASQPTPERIVFGTGETSADRSGTASPDYSPMYIIDILADQNVYIQLQSGGGVANFTVVGVKDRQIYKYGSDGSTDVSFRTPIRQDYVISIFAPVPTEYNLHVEVAPLSYPTPVPNPPVQIHVPPGATGTTINGTTAPYGTDVYVAAAQGGQVMTVGLQSTGSQLRFSVVDQQTGAVLEPLSGPSPVWSGTLPQTGNYVISVVSSVNQPVNYTLSVDFSPLTPTAAPSRTRIQFAPGAVSATVNGTVVPPNAVQYILAASGGQSMQVSTMPYGAVGVSVYGADGTVLQSSMGGLPSFSGTLPSTQDWIISLTSLTGGTVNFSMTVTVR